MGIPLTDVLKTTTRKITLKRKQFCKPCKGDGVSQEADAIQACVPCKGTGRLLVTHGNLQIQSACPHCGGQGKKLVKPCNTCNGRGLTEAAEEMTIRIPSGVCSGDTLRVSSKGNDSRRPGGIPGDLFVTMEVGLHPIFDRDESDLLLERKLSFTTATLGGPSKIPVLSEDENETKEITIPAGIADNQVIEYPDLGLPTHGSEKRGKLIVRFSVDVPKLADLTTEQKDLLQQLHKTFEEEAHFT